MNRMSMNRMKGQAITEVAVALPVFVFLVTVGFMQVQAALQERQEGQQMANLALAQGDERSTYGLSLLDTPYWNDELKLWINWSKWMALYSHRDYPFAFAALPFEVLTRYENGLDMRNDNLWEVDIAEYGHFEWMRYQRLRDDWSPRRQGQIQQRPAVLSVGNLLDNSAIQALQRGLVVLPMGRELHPDSLIPGYVDTDVVPEQAVCDYIDGLPLCE